MSQTLANGIVVPTNPDSFANLTGDLATMGNSANVVIPVASQAARDALTKKAGLCVSRTDLPGAPIETCDGTNWTTMQPPGLLAAATVSATNPLSGLQAGSLVPLIQAGSTVVTTDVNGYASIGYPIAFPNGIIAPVVCNGDNSITNGARLLVTLGTATQTTSQIHVRVWDTGANAAYASTSVRIDWIAAGW